MSTHRNQRDFLSPPTMNVTEIVLFLLTTRQHFAIRTCLSHDKQNNIKYIKNIKWFSDVEKGQRIRLVFVKPVSITSMQTTYFVRPYYSIDTPFVLRCAHNIAKYNIGCVINTPRAPAVINALSLRAHYTLDYVLFNFFFKYFIYFSFQPRSYQIITGIIMGLG